MGYWKNRVIGWADEVKSLEQGADRLRELANGAESEISNLRFESALESLGNIEETCVTLIVAVLTVRDEIAEACKPADPS